ncbi:MAG: 50S ribosomal protein L11 methyltransferase [Desulfobulbus sp.]|nr:MAG: 50S ribosomal protein L11 methyltransferase [Desulfobulbus sp.]
MNTPNKWLKVSLTCPTKIAEAASDLIGVLSRNGVEIRPLPDRRTNEITTFFPLTDTRTKESVEAESETILKSVTVEMEKLYAIYNLIPNTPQGEVIDDQDWATSWQQFFTAREIIPGLVIKPSWEEYRPTAGQKIITMDPGMAFGTGQHASTKLALTLMSPCFKNPRAGKPARVLDVGTGTGILAMAAAMFGADQVLAIDNDPEAVKVARHNVAANSLDWTVAVDDKPLAEVQGSFNLILANIVHDVLCTMAPDFKRLLQDKGLVILSGILRGKQVQNLEKVFTDNGLELLCTEHEEEWAAMLLQGH